VYGRVRTDGGVGVAERLVILWVGVLAIYLY
jgi:hypothetical protein